MDGRTGRWAVGPLLSIALLPICPSAHLTAQEVAPNRATAYLFPTDVRDARAVWVNPSGLAVLREASIYAELNVGDPGSKGRLRQINAGFNSRGLSVAYQRDILDDGLRGSTLRIGLAGGAQGLQAGLAIARYSGTSLTSTGWDIGTTYTGVPHLTVGLVTANIGQPRVAGLLQRLTFVPGFTWRPAPIAGLALSSDARITPDSVESYAFGLAWRSNNAAARWPIEIIARMDTDRGLRRGAFALGFSIGGENRFGAVATAPGDVARINGASVYGLVTREPAPGRR